MTTPFLPPDLDQAGRRRLAGSLRRVLDLAGPQELPQDRAIAARATGIMADLEG